MQDTRDAHEAGKPARIMNAAEELLLKRGFKGVTIADIADRAHIGKGTVYLYWPTTKSLFLGLLGRSFLGVLDEVVEQIRARPELVRPDRLCPHMIHGVLARPLVRALQTSDADVLGALADDPRSQQIMDRQGAASLLGGLLPVWRRHGLARTDWPLDRQAYALEMLAAGFFATSTRRPSSGSVNAAARDVTLADAIAAVLGMADVSFDTLDAAALEAIEILEQAKVALGTSIEPPNRVDDSPQTA